MGGGGSSHETHYTYVDNTAIERERARQRELERLEHERRQREHEERLRIEEERRKEEERKRAEYERQRNLEKAQEEERRRKEEEKRMRLERNFVFDEMNCSITNLATKPGWIVSGVWN